MDRSPLPSPAQPLPTPVRGDLRVGDAERAAAADRLSAHAAAGRLSLEELEQRSALAQRAVFARELTALEADLPVPASRRPPRRRRPVPFPPAVFVALAALFVLTSVAAGHPVGFPVLLALLAWRLAATGAPRRALGSENRPLL